MKKTILIVFPLLLATSLVLQAAPCASGTLATYDTPGFSCTIDGLTFSDFGYTSSQSGGAFAPDASGVTVTPETVGGEVGFLFNAAWLAGSKQTEDAFITYTASCSDGSACIDDLVLAMVGGATGTGTASVAEIASNGANPTTDQTNQTPPPVTFSPAVDSLNLSKDIAVSGGTDGTGHISGVTNLFSTTTTTMTPEPSLLLFCVGMLAVIPAARSRLTRKNP